MHKLFSEPNYRVGAITPNGWNNAVNVLYAEMNKLAKVFRTTAEWVPNTHQLVKLLKADNTPLYKNYDSTVETARNRWNRDANHFGISTIYRKSDIIGENLFYPRNVTEVMVSDDSIPFGLEVANDWKQAEPIKVLDHPYHDLNLSIPNGKFDGGNVTTGQVYICINIPILILQYRLWQKYEAERGGIDPERADIFLVRYPMFNLLTSHLDVVLRNRFIELYNDRTPAPFRTLRQGGCAVNDTSSYVDRSLRECVTRIKSGKYTFAAINQQIPQLNSGNMVGTLSLPQMTYTRSVRWVYDVSRITWLNFLAAHNNERPNENNRQELDYMKKRLIAMRTDREFYMLNGVATSDAFESLGRLLNV